MNLVRYLGMCLLVGLHPLVPYGGATDHRRIDVELMRIGSNLSGPTGEDSNGSNETTLGSPGDNVIQGYNDSMTTSFGDCPLGKNRSQLAQNGTLIAQTHPTKNETGIPMELVFGWWSVVRRSGNEVVSKPKFPWVVAVQSKRGPSNLHLCSGNILTKLHLLSTCRCLSTPTGSTVMPLVPKDPSTIRVIAGVSMLNIPLKEQLLYGQIRNAVAISIHPYCTVTQKYDYAVIELEYYLYYTSSVLPIPDPFVAFRAKKSEGKGSRISPMQENDVCEAAGWLVKQTYWAGDANDPEGEQKLSEFKIIGRDRCLASTPVGQQLVCTKVISPRTPTNGNFAMFSSRKMDVGSGLVCNGQVTAILSYHSGDFAVFSSIRGALSFIWQYYQDLNDVYLVSSNRLPAVSSILLIFTIHLPVIATYV